MYSHLGIKEVRMSYVLFIRIITNSLFALGKEGAITAASFNNSRSVADTSLRFSLVSCHAVHRA